MTILAAQKNQQRMEIALNIKRGYVYMYLTAGIGGFAGLRPAC